MDFLNLDSLNQQSKAELTEIRNSMEARRTKMNEQIYCSNISSKICDGINEKKTELILHDKVASFEETDKTLYDYIRGLEQIRYGIWCPNCDIMKSMGARPESIPAESPPKSNLDITRLEKDIQAIELILYDTRKLFEVVVVQYETLQHKLLELRGVICNEELACGENTNKYSNESLQNALNHMEVNNLNKTETEQTETNNLSPPTIAEKYLKPAPVSFKELYEKLEEEYVRVKNDSGQCDDTPAEDDNTRMYCDWTEVQSIAW